MKRAKKTVCVSGSERAFMSGVAVLTASTIIVKIIGLAYKIPLFSVLRTEGMGYFNTAYEIFALLCGVSTSGMPVAVSMLVSSSYEAGNTARARGIYKTASALLLTKGVLFSSALALFAEPISRMVGNRDAYLAVLAISPSLLFCCIGGAVRGYFQGKRLMLPTAVSQLTEAVAKLTLGVGFALVGVRMGMSLSVSAALAVLGVSVGSLLSAIYLLARKAREQEAEKHSRDKDKKRGGYFFELLHISLPITICSALTGTTRIVDMTFILRRLSDIGVSAAEANRIYGAYTTLALPVFGLVPAFVPPITESLIPRLSAAIEAKNRAEQSRAIYNAVRLTVFIGMPASMAISLYAEEIIALLFGADATELALAAPLLSALGASVLFSCLITATNTVLQSSRKVLLPIISLLAGAIVKAAGAYILIGRPSVGVMGAPISTLLSNIAVLGINIIFIYKYVSRETGMLAVLPKPFLASVVSMLVSYAVYIVVDRALNAGGALPFLIAGAVAIASYFGLCVALGVVSKDDLKMIKRKD
ncbi:MAG: polysaccharide biosynthesis protein [Clostridia bacterium]|nr:polysaccharide biosynthesis protein [Clostridia bacterium]